MVKLYRIFLNTCSYVSQTIPASCPPRMDIFLGNNYDRCSSSVQLVSSLLDSSEKKKQFSATWTLDHGVPDCDIGCLRMEWNFLLFFFIQLQFLIQKVWKFSILFGFLSQLQTSYKNCNKARLMTGLMVGWLDQTGKKNSIVLVFYWEFSKSQGKYSFYKKNYSFWYNRQAIYEN